MDDCSLSKFSVAEGQLVPEFNKDQLGYHVCIPSRFDTVSLQLKTADNGASIQIKGIGSRKVPLGEGETKPIVIEVTSEDGTSKNYTLKATRLSGDDAVLKFIELKEGLLVPPFAPSIDHYTGLVPALCKESVIRFESVDADMTILVKGEVAKSELTLTPPVGMQPVNLCVQSPNKGVTKEYGVDIKRAALPFAVSVDQPRLVCPLTRSALCCPVSISTYSTQCYSSDIMLRFSRVSLTDPVGISLPTRVHLPGSEPLSFSSWMNVFENVREMLHKDDAPDAKKYTTFQFVHSITTPVWLSDLQGIPDVSDPKILTDLAEQAVKRYLDALRGIQYDVAHRELKLAQQSVAKAIKLKPRDATFHFLLAQLLEESYLAQEIFGVDQADTAAAGSAAAGTDMDAQTSSKQEECDAICELRGVKAKDPLPNKLQVFNLLQEGGKAAISDEYHSLLEKGDSGADHVQKLYNWFARHATQDVVARKAKAEQSPIARALLKYKDSLSLSEKTVVYHFHVGKLQFLQQEWKDARERFESCLALDPNCVEARLLLCCLLHKQGKCEEARPLIPSVIGCSLSKLLEERDTTFGRICGSRLVGNFWILPNYLILTSFYELASCLLNDAKSAALAQRRRDTASIFHHLVVLCCESLVNITSNSSDLYGSTLWLLQKANFGLLDIEIALGNCAPEFVVTHATVLLWILRQGRAQHQLSVDELRLQVEVTRLLAFECPSNSKHLSSFGEALLSLSNAHVEVDTSALSEAKGVFEAALELEGKSATSTIPSFVKDHEWFIAMKRKRVDEAPKVAKTEKPQTEADSKAAPTSGVKPKAPGKVPVSTKAAGSGLIKSTTTSPRKPTAAPLASAPRKAAAQSKATTSMTGRGTAGAPKGRGAAAVAGAKSRASKLVAVASTPPRPVPTPVSDTPANPAESNPVKENEPAPPPAPAVLNEKRYQPRLGLARTLSKLDIEEERATSLFLEVIDMSSEMVPVYIELAERLARSDPMKAVDIYSRYPTPAQPTFDDAYVFGDIVRLLMKCEEYDDPRLESNMIAYGKILGIGALEKYVAKLEDKGRTKILMKVYAAINGRELDDPEMVAFFKYKCWGW